MTVSVYKSCDETCPLIARIGPSPLPTQSAERSGLKNTGGNIFICAEVLRTILVLKLVLFYWTLVVVPKVAIVQSMYTYVLVLLCEKYLKYSFQRLRTFALIDGMLFTLLMYCDQC